MVKQPRLPKFNKRTSKCCLSSKNDNLNKLLNDELLFELYLIF